MNITIKTIPHREQRYDTAGYWWFDDEGDLQIRVSDAGHGLWALNLGWRYEALIAFHELAEALLCQARGITTAQVDTFDKDHPYDDEPGALRNCPYRKEHFFATTVERLLAAELKVDWNDYDAVISEL